uniref:Uncharacterized protein n=1 Tax=Arcella intermedia TaxID=1963864 RepID=A0A6B2LSR0_9EUKA
MIDYKEGEVYDKKYIVVHLKQGRDLMVSYASAHYHSDAFFKFSQLNPKVEGEVRGGGIVRIDPKTRTLRTYGTSGGYGDPDIDVVRRMMEEYAESHFPGWKLEVTVTGYIRD